MSQPAEKSQDHLKWLVENRSANQRTTLDLFLTLKDNEAQINSNIIYAGLAQELAGVAFSLWRAVFLSDLTQDVENQMIDANKFLENLISNNSVGYPQDRNAREWTFQYYLSDARLRLENMASRPPEIIDLPDIEQTADTAKADWEIAQRALEKAVRNFAELTRPVSA